MSFFVAALWSIAALLAFDLVAIVLLAVRPAALYDPVSGALCQAFGFVGALFFLVLVYERERPLSQVLGFRRTNGWLPLLAVALGVALQAPLDLISSVTQKFFPLSDQTRSAMEQFLDVSTLRRKIALLVAAGLVGPVVEEVFFRGGIFRGLRRTHSAGITLLGISLLFAGAHRDLRNALPDFLGGLAMGYVRIMSGSIWPAILLHVAFNSTTVVLLVRDGPEAPPFSVVVNAVAMVSTLGLVALFRGIAVRSERCAQAREEDLA
jgi:membrane protease YdiL (CAAX protease family)